MPSFRLIAATALAAAVLFPALASAQTLPPPGAAGAPAAGARHHGHRGAVRAALSRVNLSTTQQQQISAAFAAARQANRNADPATRKANRQALRTRIDSILTPTQRVQFQTALQQERLRHRGGRRPRPTQPAPLPTPTPH
jgi:Spy/CpxP family protein refolding chaperone